MKPRNDPKTLIALVAATQGTLGPTPNEIFIKIEQASVARFPVNKGNKGLDLTSGQMFKKIRDTRPESVRGKKLIYCTWERPGAQPRARFQNVNKY